MHGLTFILFVHKPNRSGVLSGNSQRHVRGACSFNAVCCHFVALAPIGFIRHSTLLRLN